MHACDKPPGEDSIEKFLGEKLVEELTFNNPMIKYVDVLVLDNFTKNILNDKDSESEDLRDVDPTVSQENLWKMPRTLVTTFLGTKEKNYGH